MSAGCVPVVINGGGQPEIVGDSSNGSLWSSFDECIERTLAVANDREARKVMASRAIARADVFSFETFSRHVHGLLGQEASLVEAVA